MVLTRRDFVSSLGSAFALAQLSPLGAAQPVASNSEKPAEKPADKPLLRVIAYNVYVCTGWPKENLLAKQAVTLKQFPRRFADELALYSPDLINFSEAPAEGLVREIAALLEMNYAFIPSGQKWPGAILTKAKITSTQNCPLPDARPAALFTRHWGRAELKFASGAELVVHSAHLHPSDSAVRQLEIAAMLKTMQPDLAAKRSMLLMGDLNHEPLPPEYPLWTAGGWADSFVQAGTQGPGLTIKADVPDRRIDYIFTAGPIGAHVVSSEPLFRGAFRTNPDDPTSFALSDHLPQLATFSWGT